MTLRSIRAFTLVELLVALAIIGVLAAVALPSYQRSVLASGRAEGLGLLLQVASNQERFYSSSNTYSTDADPLSEPAVTVISSASGLYRVSVTACPTGTIANCFVATATPQGRQQADTCMTLTLNNTGSKGATGGTVSDCWR